MSTVPSVFQASELSRAESSRVSNIAMVSEGSSSFRNTPTVELMMPAPMRTTSGSVMKVSAIGFLLVEFFPQGLLSLWAYRSGRDPLYLASAKRHRGSWLKDHVGATPGGVVGQLPTVSGADRVLSEQNIAGVDEEVLPVPCLEIERAP